MRGAARLWPALLFACACDKEQPIDPNLGVVRLASPPPSARPSQATFSVETGSALEFDFPALAPGPAGRVRALSGAVQVNLMQLASTRATVSGDLLALETTEALASFPEPTRTALEWLGLGSERPTADRAPRRHAVFELHRLDALSAPAAHDGRVAAKREVTPAPLDGAAEENAAGAEDRVVTCVAVGDLTVNARRATIELPMTATFRFPEPALSGVAPTAIVLETSRPVALDLALFDVLPRDAHGATLAAQVSSARKAVGTSVRISARLVLAPRVTGSSQGWRAGEAH